LDEQAIRFWCERPFRPMAPGIAVPASGDNVMGLVASSFGPGVKMLGGAAQ
jgi:hypothetical protein